MAKKDEITSLEFDIKLTPNKALQEISRFGKGLTDRMKDAEGEVKKLDKGMHKFVKQFQATKVHGKTVQMLNRHYSVLGKTINNDIRHILKLRKELKGTSGDERKRKFAQIKAFTEARNIRGAISERGKVKDNLKEAGESMFNFKELQDRAEEAGEALTAPMQELFRKDAPALFKRASGLIAFTLDKTVGRMASNLQKKLMDKSHGAMARAAQLQKMGAPGSGAAAAAAKGTAGLFKGLGEVVGLFAKIGPIVSIASSFMMSFVKILIDAEAAAKDYNKQILSTTGTSEFFHRNMGNTARGVKDLDDTLRKARDGAMGYTGVLDTLKKSSMGITKDMAAGFQSALASEGVSLVKLDDAMKVSTGYSRDFASTVEQSVAYSRAFGVSLNELSQFQGQLMGDIGMGLDSVQKSFQMMANAAAESGMAANKFFGIIRSFSSDLSLFALRMEDVTKIMKTLAKSMDPREAQKFLQTISQRYKGGITDNLKHAVMAGDKNLQKLGASELNNKMKTILQEVANALGKNAEDPAIKALEGLIRDPKRDPLAIAKWKNSQDKQLDGKLMSAILDAANFATLQQTQVGRAANAGSYGPFAKQLLQLKEIGAVMQRSDITFAELLNVSQEQLLASEGATAATVEELKQATKFYQGVVIGQQDLIKKVREGTALTRQEQDTLKQLKVGFSVDAEGIARGSADSAALLEDIYKNDKDLSKTLASMDESQVGLMKDSQEEINYQKETADFQVSLLDRIGIVSDTLMNQIYNMLHDIWLVLMDIYQLIPGSRSKKDMASAKGLADESKVAGIKAAFDKHSDPVAASNEAIATVGKEVIGKINAAVAEHKKLSQDIKTEKDAGKRKAMIQRDNQLRPALAYASQANEKYLKDITADKGARFMVARLATMKGAVDKIPGLGGSAAAAPAAAPAKAAAVAVAKASPSIAPPTRAQQAETTKSVEDVHRAVVKEGVKIQPEGLRDPMAKSVYEGTSKALFEYYMYSSLDRTAVATALGQGASPAMLASSMTSGMSPQEALNRAQLGNAEGGTVTGISGSLAKVARFPAAAAGEGWASVGPGEKILPAGAGGGKGGTLQVELVMKDDFKRFIDARVIDGASKHDRNKRLR